MSKTSRIILWCVLIAVLALCVVLYISTKQTAADTTARDAGKRYAESLQAGDETPVITGGDFTITAHTFENMCTQNRASGMTETVAAQYTLARYIVTARCIIRQLPMGMRPRTPPCSRTLTTRAPPRRRRTTARLMSSSSPAPA